MKGAASKFVSSKGATHQPIIQLLSFDISDCRDNALMFFSNLQILINACNILVGKTEGKWLLPRP
jgi:hypothetical protein